MTDPTDAPATESTIELMLAMGGLPPLPGTVPLVRSDDPQPVDGQLTRIAATDEGTHAEAVRAAVAEVAAAEALAVHAQQAHADAVAAEARAADAAEAAEQARIAALARIAAATSAAPPSTSPTGPAATSEVAQSIPGSTEAGWITPGRRSRHSIEARTRTPARRTRVPDDLDHDPFGDPLDGLLDAWRGGSTGTAQAVRTRPSPSRLGSVFAQRPAPLNPSRLDTLRSAVNTSRFGIFLALLLWLVSLPSLRDATPSNYGLLFAGSPLFTLSALVAALAFCTAVRRGRFGDAVAALLAFIVIVRVTVSVITPLPIYTWTYKHIGVSEYIQQHGHLATGTDIYMSWPGAFTALAWFSSVSGVSMLTIAQWFAVGVHLLTALGIYSLARAAHRSPMAAIMAAFLAEIVNWVGQDYLSPQAIAFVLSLLVLTLLLRARESATAGWLSVPVFAVVVITHQLTPYWLLLIIGGLAFGKALRPRWLVFVYFGIALGYLAMHLKVAASYGLLSGFDPLSNAESNINTAGSAGHDFTQLMVKIPALLLWGTAAFVAVRQFRAFRRAKKAADQIDTPGHPLWIPVIMAFASFSLLAGQSYGGEAIFRVFLYSLPGCVLIVAPVVVQSLLSVPSRTGRARRLVVRWFATACVVLAAGTSLQGYYGGWFTNLVRQDSLTEMQLLLNTLPTDSLIFVMTSGAPERPTGRYVEFVANNRFYDAPVQLLPGVDAATDTAQQIAARLEQLQGQTPGPVYLVITEQMRQYSSYYGIFRPGMLDRLPNVLRTDGKWWTISDTKTLQVFRLVGSGE